MRAVVLAASAGAGIIARTTLGRGSLAPAPPSRVWWVPDHVHPLRRQLTAAGDDHVA